MRRDWPATAVDYESSVAKALLGLGGVDLARSCETDPGRRAAVVRPTLDQLGLLDLDPWGDEEESAAVVLGVRAAGAVVLPWPVVHALAVPPSARETGLYLTAGPVRRLDHADLFASAVAVSLPGGEVARVTAGPPAAAPLDPFAVPVTLSPASVDFDVPASVAMHMVLDAFWVTGALSTAASLAVSHARDREQFGRPIGKFGEIRWRLADLLVAVDGLAELALHAWWLLRRGAAGDADLLALRLQMLESADVVLSNAHQILGAMGLCDEHDVSVIDRHLQPVLHRPAGVLATTDLLARAVAADGFAATYPVPALDA
ncbi:acyl-CoA dehydrogenase family protein [Dactylosporangium sp. AC04546]|uniref:acyl-CoA dehydrogenase family protein n=1 Tax=Dactylosporangium sp. AC04546 TaxID=2862460 RepID=UPI001EDFA5A1|nr:acyl-CoA dehydrogenase family protein [Dactylosporangium sp. AC04546]WVK88461.1 acyl-CoA dehydrogenase family protein [Dactylosporangium sp. AC04546]